MNSTSCASADPPSTSLELVAELRGHDSQVWSVLWRSSTSQLSSCGGRRILLWTNELSSSDAEKTKGTKWRLKSVILNDEEHYGEFDDDVECSETLGAPMHLSPEIPDPRICQVNEKSISPTNSGTHEKTVRNLCWTSNGKVLAAASFDATGSVWTEGKSERGNKVWRCRAKIEGHENEVKAVAWSPSQQQLATCSRDKTIWIHTAAKQLGDDDDSGEDGEVEFLCSAMLSGHTQDVKCVIWHPFQDFVVSASYDNSIRLWSPANPLIKQQKATLHNSDVGEEDDDSWHCVAVLEGHQSTVWSVSFSPDGLEFASASDDKTVRVWSASFCDNLNNLPPPSASGVSKEQDPASTQISTSQTPIPSPKRGLYYQWLINPAFRGLPTVTPQSFPSSTSNNTRATETTPQPIVIPPESTAVLPVSTAQWSCSSVIAGCHDRTVYCVAWHPQLSVLATGCGDDAVRIFKRSSQPCSSMDQPLWSLLHCFYKAHSSDVNSVAWKTIPEVDGSWLLASGGDDGVVKIFRCFL